MKASLALIFLGILTPFSHAEIVSVVHPDEAFPLEKTVVWSPLFQASWDKLNTAHGGPANRVEPPNALISALDNFQWQANEVMPQGAWKVWCGQATHELLAEVNQEAAVITKKPGGPFLLPDENSAALALFGILNRDVEFATPFFPSRIASMKFRASGKEHPVRFFGARDEFSAIYGDNVRVLAWRPIDGSHALQIRCKETHESVILYLPAKPQDFTTACGWLRKWRSDYNQEAENIGKWNDSQLRENDVVQIPYVSLDTKADFSDKLSGMRFFGEGEPWKISRAEQVTRFELHEKGASVKVETSAQDDPFAEPVMSRNFIYRRPFFIFLWRDGAEWPYFGTWIGDASALEPAGS